MMRYRTLGASGLRVSEFFLGTMTFGENWGWGASTEECRRIFDAYAEAGGNVIDTANRYTEGASEQILGELLGADRDRFVVATKYTVSTRPDDPNAAGNHRKSLRGSLEQSLTRLRTDYIDLLWVHIWDPLTPVEETMRALDDVVRSGKVLYVGISDTPAWVVSRAQTLAALRGWSPFVGLQLPYSLLQRDSERELLPMAGELGLSVTAWSPLAGGRLAGTYTRAGQDGPTRVDRSEVTDREVAIAREVDAVADELGVTSAQVALAWIMARPAPAPIHPIIGARRLEQLADNLAAAELRLPAQAVARLDGASAIDLGFPHDFLENTQEFVYGKVGERVSRGVRG
jgi:aryl-alcohol dehydrogenase-like predicted oxidoreductase